MAYKRVLERETDIDKLGQLLTAREYLEARIEELEGMTNLQYVRLQQVTETIESLKNKIKREIQEV